MPIRIGIDMGGTKIEGIALDGSLELARMRVDTPRDDYPATVEAVAGIVEALEQRVGSRGSVGVGIPGTLSPATGLVKNANSVWLIGRPLLADLERRLGREVRMANDANCFAASEAADGAGAGAEVVFGAIVGTGTGAGIVVRGHVVTGPNGIAGEWGHNPLPWPAGDERPGPACYCGRHGCIETFLSGPGMQADYERETGTRRTPVEIVADADGGRSRRARCAGAVCRADGALARERRQRPRSGRHRARRRHVEHRVALRARSTALGTIRLRVWRERVNARYGGSRRPLSTGMGFTGSRELRAGEDQARPRAPRRFERRPRRRLAVVRVSVRSISFRRTTRLRGPRTSPGRRGRARSSRGGTGPLVARCPEGWGCMSECVSG